MRLFWNTLWVIDQFALAAGRTFTGAIATTGRFLLFFWRVLVQLPTAVRSPHFTIEQMHTIGITSLPLVCTTAVFTGAVIAVQAVTQFGDYLPLRYTGMVVGKSVMLELGPVLTAIVVAGRVGAAMTAEIGTMAVTEQLDAMRVLNLNPYKYLMAPRLLAGMVMLPVLTLYSSFVAILGALVIVIVMKDLPPSIFFSGVRMFYSDSDLVVGLFKATAFGIIITSFGCFFGYHCLHGAEGVGRATRSSVVASDITILITGFLISHFLLN